jgi:hypothetical protein
MWLLYRKDGRSVQNKYKSCSVYRLSDWINSVGYKEVKIEDKRIVKEL